MKFIKFTQWLEGRIKIDEKGARTRLGPYADKYGADQYPPAYHAARSAGALGKLALFHPNVLKNTNPPGKCQD